MRLKLQPAKVEDAEAVAALRNAVSDDLTFKHGKGWWTHHCTTAGVLFDLRNAKLYVALHRDEVVSSLVLNTKKPWAIGRKQVALNREVSSLSLEGSKTRFVRGQHHHNGLIPHPIVDDAVLLQAVPVIGCPASA